MQLRPDLEIRDRSLVLSGFVAQLRVRDGYLEAADIIHGYRQTLKIHQQDRLRRLVVTAHSGTLSIDALRWCADAGVSVIQLDITGRPVGTWSGATRRDAELRRRQALAPLTPEGLQLAHRLIAAKLEGQLCVLRELRAAKATAQLARMLERLPACSDLNAVRILEARAGWTYWRAWVGLELRFPARERAPEHWRVFSSRHSVFARSPWKAIDAFNAILNFAYGTATAECSIALTAAALDPLLGIVHDDKQFRASMSADILEPLRPRIDRAVLDLVRGTTFTREDFYQERDGAVRLKPELRATCVRIGLSVRAEAERWALRAGRQILRIELPARLTAGPHRFQTSLRSGNRVHADKRTRTRRERRVQHASRCAGCGAEVFDSTHRGTRWCPECLPAQAVEWARQGRVRQRELRATGQDPLQTPEVRHRRREKFIVQARANAAWKGDVDRRQWEEVGPLVRSLPAPAIRDATGLSLGYARRLRDGHRPHPRHWAALQELARQSSVSEGTST